MNYAVIWGRKVARALLEETGMTAESTEVGYGSS